VMQQRNSMLLAPINETYLDTGLYERK
jgi:hypothetical protein